MRKLFLLIAVAGLNADGNAQENKTDFRGNMQLGLKVGGNYSNVYDRHGEQFSSSGKLGFAAGAFLAIPIRKSIGLQPELLFSQKGFRAKGRVLNGDYEITRTTSYIDLPLMFTFRPSEFVTLLIGPQYSYLIKQKDVFANAVTTIEQEQEFENADLRKNNLCFTAGFDLNLKHIIIGSRIGWDVLNNNGDGTSTTPRYKNFWVQGTVGYRFYH